MEIWQFNDPEPLGPFLRTIEDHAPHPLDCAHRLFTTNLLLSRADIVCLARGLVSSSAKVRQAVEVLIFSPPVEDELTHFRRLLRWFPDWLPSKWYEQPPLPRLVVELIFSLENPGDCRPLATILRIALKQRLRSRHQQTVLPPGPLELVVRRQLLSVLTRRLSYHLRLGLRRRCLEESDLSLSNISEAIVASSRFPPMGSLRYWRKMKSLGDIANSSSLGSYVRPADQGSCPRSKRNLRILSWGQRRFKDIDFLEKLISYQANELAEVFRLATAVSRSTRRVVLTLHNASLGAATGWGAPAFSQQLPRKCAEPFFNRVNSLRRDYLANLCFSNSAVPSSQGNILKEEVDNLFLLWAKRLIRPRLLKDLWALRMGLILNNLPVEEWQQLFTQAKELLDDSDYQRLVRGTDLAIAFAQPKTSRRNLQETMLWYQKRRESYHQLFSLLWALIATGDEWIRAERISHLVLPIIDKFFISSQRDQDLTYLPLFVELADWMNHSPLFLLIDDTSRAAGPSLESALDRWCQHHGFVGLGVFAGGSDVTKPPLESILANSSIAKLFALRPISQVHNPISLRTLLALRPRDFLTPAKYDSSWKDNLPFLYHSTQVAPFSGPVTQADEFDSAVITSAGPMAFGRYYRCKLRHLAMMRLGLSAPERESEKELASLDSLWRQYAELANLF